jgi:nitrogen fixation protein NifU and related proteins
MFSATVLDHFRQPRNAGELPNATHTVEVSNPVCGDVLRLAVRMDGGQIAEARFLCRGCTTAIAAASLLTERLLGRTRDTVQAITAAAISDELGGLPPATLHGAQLAESAVVALHDALHGVPRATETGPTPRRS